MLYGSGFNFQCDYGQLLLLRVVDGDPKLVSPLVSPFAHHSAAADIGEGGREERAIESSEQRGN